MLYCALHFIYLCSKPVKLKTSNLEYRLIIASLSECPVSAKKIGYEFFEFWGPLTSPKRTKLALKITGIHVDCESGHAYISVKVEKNNVAITVH